MTQQPEWEFVTNLGDVHVADYGGFLVYRDKTGVYDPEVELYEASDDETGGTMYRFILEKPTNTEWFMDKLSDVAASCGIHVDRLRADLMSDDITRRALGYRDLVGYFGAFEFDQYPVQLSEKKAQERYANIR